MVQALLDLNARLDDLVIYSLNGAENFYNTANLAFDSFVNEGGNKPRELIEKFIDGILKNIQQKIYRRSTGEHTEQSTEAVSRH